MTDALATVRAALDDAVDASSLANRNVSASLQAALLAIQAVNLAPPPPVLRIVKADLTGAGDATSDFQASLDGAGINYVPAGTYLIDAGVAAKIRSATTVIFHKDALLKLKPNALERYYGLLAEDANDIQIIGGSILGDRLAHTYGHGTDEHGMGVGIRGCARVHISDMRIEQTTGDGISAGGTDLTFERIVSTGNRRQGMSLYAGRGYRILGGEYSNTGDMGTNTGTDPRAGIDIEQDAGDVDDVLFDGVNFLANQTAGLLLWTRAGLGKTSNVRAIRCNFDGNANGANTKGLGGPVDLSITRSRFNRNRGAAVRAESGSIVSVGTSDPADANLIIGMAARTAFTKSGIATRYDLQAIGPSPLPAGVIKAGINNYA